MSELREAICFTRREGSVMHRTFGLARTVLLLLTALAFLRSCVFVLADLS